MDNTGKYNFFKIENIIIRNFSLYSKKNEVNVINERIEPGVYCLAGANGLGKSTFLNLINYGLTGLVLEPNKEVFSPSEISKSNKNYTKRYFEGRIKSKNKDIAEIEITIKIKNHYYRIVRGFIDNESLNDLEIFEVKDGKRNSKYNASNKSPRELNNDYQNELVRDMGIKKFDYFQFFQLYVLTFDENRRMLFWDNRASTNTLSIAFNYDLEDTERILKLKREMESLESYGRNARWQASQIKKEREKLLATKKELELINFNDLKKEYNQLVSNTEKAEIALNNIRVEYDTLLKRQNIINSELLQLKTKYKKIFSQYSEPRSKLLENQYIKFSHKENKCFLCGASGALVLENITKNMHHDNCPVCNTVINENRNSEQGELLSTLEIIDRDIAEKNIILEDLISDSDSKKVEIEKAEFDYQKIKEELNAFEKENSKINFTLTGDSITDDLLIQYQQRFEKEDLKAKEYYKKRDNLKPEYDNLLQQTTNAYREAESVFVPLFKNIAKSFIGLDLDISFIQRGSKDIALNFELLGTSRTESHQLSESQRFFLDIALRMALVVYLSKTGNEALLLIDTPEGSLDIAYESRVGTMFANFITEYKQNIIMTANINASQLLISLASKCREENMKFRRMLDWTDLTEIQKEGEHLFNKVYQNIDEALQGMINE